MPSWKKVALSGSDASFNSLEVTTSVTAASFTGSFSGSVAAPGATTQVVYNNGGTLFADSGLVYSGSRLGIGTPSPTTTLEVTGQVSLRASSTSSAATQFPVFTADPSSTTRTLVTRTPAQVLSDIGAQAALTNPVTGTGASGQVTFWGGPTSIRGDNGLWWDDSNKRLGIGTTSPVTTLDVFGNTYSRGDLRFGESFTGASNNTGVIKWQGAVASVPNSLGIFTWGDARDIQIGGNNVIFGIENGSERMRITAAGNVLVGTTTDAGRRLNVNGSVAWGDAAGQYMYAGGTSHIFAYSSNILNLLYSGGPGGFGINNAADNTRIFQVTDSGSVGIGTGSATPISKLHVLDSSNFFSAFFTGGTGNGVSLGAVSGVPSIQGYEANGSTPTNLSLQSQGGNVGIGTTTPNNKLSVAGNIETTGYGKIGFNVNDSYGSFPHYGLGYAGGTTATNLSGFYGISFGTFGLERMRINLLGYVGIGTSNPLYKLDIKGSNASTLRLDNDGSQFTQLVFERNTIPNSGADILLDGTNETFGIRTLATYPITFSTSTSTGAPAERMRITVGGNLLVGTTTEVASGFGSNYKLVVDSTNQYNTALFRSTSHAMVQVESTSAANQAIMRFFSPTRGWGIGLNTDGRFFIGDETAPATRLSITTGGNVLIGTTTNFGFFGTTSLNVDRDFNSGHNIRISNQANNANASANLIFGARGNSWVTGIGSDTSALGNNLYWSLDASASPLQYKMVLTTTGNLLLGTTTDNGARLRVEKGTLGGLANDYLSSLSITNIVPNDENVEFGTIRIGAGSGWESSGFRIQRKIDNTWMGYIQFGGFTDDSAGISFGTGASTGGRTAIPERMRIRYNGNVGIGTPLPTYKFNVVTDAVAGKQNLAAIDRTAQNFVTFTNPQYSTDSSIGLMLRVFPQSDARQGAGIIASGGVNNGTTDLHLFVSNSSDSGVTSTSYGAVSINGHTGNVGIGTTSPSAKLQVVKGSQSDTVSIANSAAYIYGIDVGLAIGQDNGAGGYGTWVQSARLSDNASFNMALNPNGGDVGVGTPAPTERVDVNGNIRVRSLTTTAGDFVTADANGVFSRRTAAQVLGDIGAQPALTNPVTGTGSSGQVTFWGGPTSIRGDNGLWWDDSNKRLGIGTTTPNTILEVMGTSQGEYFRGGAGTLTERSLRISNFTSDGFAGVGHNFNSPNSNGVLSFSTNSTERIRITSGGNVLIGTTTDNGYKLEVNGNIKAGFGNSTALLVQSTGTATTQAAIAIQQLTGEGDTVIFADYEPFAEYGIIARNSTDSIDFTGGTTAGSLDNYNITNRTGNTRTAYVKTRIGLGSGNSFFGGNVGIGTLSPTSLSGYIIQTINGTNGSFTEYQENSTNIFRVGSDVGEGGFLLTAGALPIRFWTNSSERMRITSGGAVGIGTTSPAANLDVFGVVDTAGTSSLLLRSGNTSSNFNSNQITFGFSNSATYRHAIKTRHNGGTNVGNAIDFYTWSVSQSPNDIGNNYVMSMDGQNISLFNVGSFGGGEKVIYIANAATEPTTAPSSGVGGILYVWNGALKYRGSNGTETVIAPA